MQNGKVAYISNIQRFSLYDGPGIRTTAFLLGCPLHCKWCHNPEAIQKTPHLMLDRTRCTSCGVCFEMCPNGAIRRDLDGRIITDWSQCKQCFSCVSACVFGARKCSASLYSVEQLVSELEKDAVMYSSSGGGITLSGGEPLLHAQYCLNVLKICKQKGFHTAVETSGYGAWSNLEQIASYTDLFLFDLKAITPHIHEQWTGVNNQIILDNLCKLSEIHRNIVIRVPLIPGVNDSVEEFLKIVKKTMDMGISNLHIMPFHQIGAGKYDMLGIPYELKELEEPEETVQNCANLALQAGLSVSIGGSM